MSLAIPRVKPLGWALYEILTSGQMTQIDLNISLLDQAIGATDLLAAHAAFRALKPIDMAAALTVPTRLTSCRVRTATISEDIVLMFSKNSADSNKVYYSTVTEGTNVAGNVDATFTGDVVFAVGGALDTLIVSTSTEAWYTTNRGGAWTKITTWGDYPNGHIGGYYANLVGLGIERYYVVTGLAVIFASTPFGTGAGFASIPGSISGLSSIEFADDGDENLVCCVKIAANSFYSIFHTADGGDTWALSMDLPGTAGSVFYSKHYGLFFAWASTGAMWSSPDGLTWTSIGSGTATPGNGMHGAGVKCMVAAGAAIVRLLSVTATMYGTGAIAYSLDLGDTWFTVALNYNADITPVELAVFNGRVHLMTKRVWLTGVLEPPALPAF